MWWFAYFIIAFVVAMLGTWLVTTWETKSKAKHSKRFGGLIVGTVFVLCVVFNPELEKTWQLKGLITGTVAILIFGFLDDIKNVSWFKQLIFQFMLSVLLILFGYSIHYISGPFGEMIRLDGWQISNLQIPVWGSILLAVWTICIINAINWADGIDGLAGGLAMVGGLAMLWISLLKDVNQPAIAILALIFIGAVLGFWWYNFPRAKIELGTSGSYFVGFFLAGAAVISGTKIATTMIVLALPVVDFFWVIFERIGKKKLPTSRDHNHLHHKLLRLGWSNNLIVVSYLTFVCCVLVASFFSETRFMKFSLILFEICAILIFLYIISKKHDLLIEKQKSEEN